MRIETPLGSLPAMLAAPAGPWRSAVVVAAQGPGLDDHAALACQELAAAGHGAVVVDFGAPALDNPAEIRRLTRSVDAALTVVREAAPAPPPRFGVLGYGGAGLVALTAGHRCQVGAAISVYGEGVMRLREGLARIIDKPKPHAAALLCLLGGEDVDVRPADLGTIRDRLDTFGVKHTFIVYPRTNAGFCHEGHPKYRAAEAQDAWGRVLRALETAQRQRHRFRARRDRVEG